MRGEVIKRTRLLVVEDNITILEDIKSRLLRLGYETPDIAKSVVETLVQITPFLLTKR